MNTTKIDTQELDSQLFYPMLKNIKLRTRLQKLVIEAREERNKTTETQKDVAKWVEISLTKVKEIENGTCKDICAVFHYLGWFGKV